MKTIGLIGGLGWRTILYYAKINECTNRRLGGDASARILLYSYNEADLNLLDQDVDWRGVARSILNRAGCLRLAHADFLAIASNTAHRALRFIERPLPLPIVDIAEAVAGRVREGGITRIGILGTDHIFQTDLYDQQFSSRGICALWPGQNDQHRVHSIIKDELSSARFVTNRSNT